MVATFDTLTYARKLKEAGFTEQQAEAQAEALMAVVETNLATKHDIELLRKDMELLRRDMKELESRIVLRLGSLIVVAVGALAVLIKIL